MSKIQRIAIKYFIIGIGAMILGILIPLVSLKLMELFNIENQIHIHSIIMKNSNYSKNLIIGLFILFDSFRIVKNKISISILGFCIPIIGVCFLIIENYLHQKSFKNE